MNLQGLNILVDGYNLELPQGTGIKTYTNTLIKALKMLGANVSVLFSKPTIGDAILDEVLFFEQQESSKFDLLLSKLELLKYILRFSQKPQSLKFTDKVIIPDKSLDEIIHSVDILNLKNCYNSASVIYKLFGYYTKINPPGKTNIWHKTYPLIPIFTEGSKDIVTIHDLVPLKIPYTTLDNKKIFYKALKSVTQQSKAIITVSENSKRDILDFFDVNPDKIHVTYQAVNQLPMDCSDEELFLFLKRYKLKPQKYILFVGAIEPKKNVGRLINAYAGMDTDFKLVIAGKKAWLWEKEIGHIESIFGPSFPRKVKILNYVNSQSLRYLYRGAFCFVFPSIYEGFGLPPLEAMTLGCPVITSNTSCLPEVCSNAALYVNPLDDNDIRMKIEMLINEPELRSKLIDLGKERAKFFSLENYAKRLYEAYAKVI